MSDAFDPLLIRGGRHGLPGPVAPARTSGPSHPGRARRRMAIGALVVAVLAGAAAIVALPVRSYFHQQQEIASAEQALAELQAGNRDLADQVAELQTPAAVEQLARQELHLVKPGEEAFAVLPPQFPTNLPNLFPYPLARQLLEARR